jgi:YesN/AraC family two-component response regulator
LVYCQEIESNLNYLQYQYYRQINKQDLARMHFEKALEHARNIQSNAILSDLLLTCVFDASVGSEGVSDEILADSVIYFAKLTNDPFKLQHFTDTLARHFSQTGNRLAFEKYNALDQDFTDSLEKLRGSRELFESEILISSAAAEQAIQKLTFEKTENLRSLKYHRIIILFILTIAVLAALTLYILIRQYRKLHLAYQNLTNRILQSVRNEQSKNSQNGSTPNESFSEIIHNLEHLIHHERIYLNPDLTLNELATSLQTNKTYLSSILNQQFGMNFNEYINQFRIEEACRIIMAPAIYRLSFDQILEKSGFHTKSTFYAAFKKFTGMSPATFLRTAQKSPKTIAKGA